MEPSLLHQELELQLAMPELQVYQPNHLLWLVFLPLVLVFLVAEEALRVNVNTLKKTPSLQEIPRNLE